MDFNIETILLHVANRTSRIQIRSLKVKANKMTKMTTEEMGIVHFSSLLENTE